MMISSLLPRRLANSFMKVRLTCTSKRRVPKNGIFALSTYPSSMTSPVLISLTALSTVCGFMWLPEPRSSSAPHFDGQRWFSGGGVQLGAWARTALLAASIAPNTTPNAMRCMVYPPRVLVVSGCRPAASECAQAVRPSSSKHVAAVGIDNAHEMKGRDWGAGHVGRARRWLAEERHKRGPVRLPMIGTRGAHHTLGLRENSAGRRRPRA